MLDADIRDFFGQLDHSWLRRFLRHRIADERVLRLIDKWLTVGDVEDGSGRGATRVRHRGDYVQLNIMPPYEQRRVMRSAGLFCLVRGGAGGRALRINPGL